APLCRPRRRRRARDRALRQRRARRLVPRERRDVPRGRHRDRGPRSLRLGRRARACLTSPPNLSAMSRRPIVIALLVLGAIVLSVVVVKVLDEVGDPAPHAGGIPLTAVLPRSMPAKAPFEG